jgi:hypothetical protein
VAGPRPRRADAGGEIALAMRRDLTAGEITRLDLPANPSLCAPARVRPNMPTEAGAAYPLRHTAAPRSMPNNNRPPAGLGDAGGLGRHSPNGRLGMTHGLQVMSRIAVQRSLGHDLSDRRLANEVVLGSCCGIN